MTARERVGAFVFAVSLALLPQGLKAADLVAYALNGTLDSNYSVTATSVAQGLAAGVLHKSTSLTASNAGNAFVADDWPASNLDPNKYFEFTVVAKVGVGVTYDEISFSLYNNISGLSSWELRSSADAFGSALAAGAVVARSGGGTAILADISALGNRAGQVTFRLYTFNNSGAAGPLRRGLRGIDGSGQGLTVRGVTYTDPISSLATWNLNGLVDSGLSFAATSQASGVLAFDLTSAGLNSGVFANGYLASGWSAGAVDKTEYFEFSIAPEAAYVVTPQLVDFSIWNSYFGPCSWQLRSSLDNFSSVLDAGYVEKIAGDGQLVVADISAVGAITGQVNFRFYTHNNSGDLNPTRRGIRAATGGAADGLVIYGVASVNGPQTFDVSGRLLYEDRIWDKNGYTGGVQNLPIRHADVEIVNASTGGVLATTSTDGNGNFLVPVTTADQANLYARVLVSSAGHPIYDIIVTDDFYGNTVHAAVLPTFSNHSVVTPLDMGTWTIQDTDGFGIAQAFNIYDCAVDAWDYLAQPQVLGRYPTSSEAVRYYWSTTSTTVGSYFNGYLIKISPPSSGDTDGWSDAVILHEIGHWVANKFHRDTSPGGSHFIGDNAQDPRLSYGEGYATIFGGEVRAFREEQYGLGGQVSVYADLGLPPAVGVPGSLEFSFDFETGLYGDGTPIGQIGQANETLVASVMWDLVDGVGTADNSPAADDDNIDANDAELWQVLLSHIATLPGSEAVTLEDIVQGWNAVIGSGQAVALDALLNDTNITGFEADVHEPDNTAAMATSYLVGSYGGVGPGNGVVLNEIEVGGEDAIELFNRSDTPVDLTNWTVQAATNTTAGEANLTFIFPAYVIEPGGFVLVRERGDSANNTASDLYGDSFSVPWVAGSAGACTIFDELSVVVDFVRWDGQGDPSVTTVPSGTTFVGNLNSPNGGLTLSRDLNGTDTDAAVDWSPQANSGGFPNGLPTQSGTMYDVGDEDWITMNLLAGEMYTLRTSALYGAIDSRIDLFKADGETPLAANEDRDLGFDESRLRFVANETESVYARITHVGSVTTWGLYSFTAYQHPTSNLFGDPVGLMAAANNSLGTGDQTLVSWLNGGTYDQIQVDVFGPTPSTIVLPGSAVQWGLSLDQGVHRVEMFASLNGVDTGTQTAYVYAGLISSLLSDGFESQPLADWTMTGQWGLTQALANTGTNAMTINPGGLYSNLTESILEWRVPARLGSAATLSFTQICITEADFDFSYVEITADDGQSWDTLAVFDQSSDPRWLDSSADPGDWRDETIPLSAYQGDQVRIRFRLQTDEGVTRDGWYLDSVAIDTDLASGVAEGVPAQFELQANYPNPFNPSTSLAFTLPKASQVQMVVYDLRGREVAVLIDEQMGPGRHLVLWDGTDSGGANVASGVYLARLRAGQQVKTRKMVLVE